MVADTELEMVFGQSFDSTHLEYHPYTNFSNITDISVRINIFIFYFNLLFTIFRIVKLYKDIYISHICIHLFVF